MVFEIHPENPQARFLSAIVKELEKGGVGIIPTDSVYSFCCLSDNLRGIEKIAKLTGKKFKQSNFSMMFMDLSQVSAYTKPFNNTVFRTLQRNLPGPFTFILKATNEVGRVFKNNRKTIGVRIPNNKIVLDLIALLGKPLVVASLHDEDEIIEYTNDPEMIVEKWENQVRFIVDGGIGNISPSTVVDCSEDEMEIIREGIQELQ
ncbi:MAG: tRNA threonylcarbamoyl adenosine modification protein (Sua5/YciO/YrdC/YwlC family) [Sphingobacteriales bacterium]|jgi:tRNA threonylcarbamoyl adenosine modification protein (Sua5/YciO/YrdC/YwlC family)